MSEAKPSIQDLLDNISKRAIQLFQSNDYMHSLCRKLCETGAFDELIEEKVTEALRRHGMEPVTSDKEDKPTVIDYQITLSKDQFDDAEVQAVLSGNQTVVLVVPGAGEVLESNELLDQCILKEAEANALISGVYWIRIVAITDRPVDDTSTPVDDKGKEAPVKPPEPDFPPVPQEPKRRLYLMPFVMPTEDERDYAQVLDGDVPKVPFQTGLTAQRAFYLRCVGMNAAPADFVNLYALTDIHATNPELTVNPGCSDVIFLKSLLLRNDYYQLIVSGDDDKPLAVLSYKEEDENGWRCVLTSVEFTARFTDTTYLNGAPASMSGSGLDEVTGKVVIKTKFHPETGDYTFAADPVQWGATNKLDRDQLHHAMGELNLNNLDVKGYLPMLTRYFDTVEPNTQP